MGMFVQTQTRIYNLILISASYYYAPCMALALALDLYSVYMIRERHVILKAALHSGLYSCFIAAASYIIMLYCLVYTCSLKKINVSIYF